MTVQIANPKRLIGRLVAVGALAAALTGCVTPMTTGDTGQAFRSTGAATLMGAQERTRFEKDREAILAMVGAHQVTFDFTETVSFVEGYEPKEPYITGAYEVVRVIEDTGDFISLQHVLVVGGEEAMPVKHWRQDWIYEPKNILMFVGGNAWRKIPVSSARAEGRWAQIVYQVDDAPRYAALARWDHADGASQWTPPSRWRPLPRRDATKRGDYHAIDAVNRHAITPQGWVHEQDNSKLQLIGGRQLLVREVGVNRYIRVEDGPRSVADDYWKATEDYWAAVRAKWAEIEGQNDAFALTIQGEPEELYMKILGLAEAVRQGDKSTEEAAGEAVAIIDEYTTTDLRTLQDRLADLEPYEPAGE